MLNIRKVLLLPFLALSSVALGQAADECRSDYVRPDFAVLESNLAEARARWEGAGLKDYRYDFAQFVAPAQFPVARISVKNAAVTTVEEVEGEVVSSEPLPEDTGQTMVQRFDEIERGIAAAQKQPCSLLSAKYDADDGHPLQLTNGTALAGLQDGVGGWEISAFEAL